MEVGFPFYYYLSAYTCEGYYLVRLACSKIKTSTYIERNIKREEEEEEEEGGGKAVPKANDAFYLGFGNMLSQEEIVVIRENNV